MLFDPDRALEALSADPPSGPWPEGGPEADFTRSPAAARVGALAAESGLFLFHFEHRAHLPLPDAFLADGADPSLAEPPEWRDGVLPEAKYQSFRHDLLVGSFHPGHRGKWTTHELCHALVGFGWAPGAPRLFHATAARLAELLPVVLYYFLDEVRLRRCPDHAGGGPLYRSFCPACEAAAAEGPVDPSPEDRETLRDAARFLDRELAAVARTRRTGRPIGHRWGSLDLCTDGVAYAAAHGNRLDSEAFHRLADGFLGAGCHETLDALEARVVAVARAIAGEGSPEPMAPTPAAGRWTWLVQDLAWQMIHEAELASPELAAEAHSVVDQLAAADPGPEAVAAARARWPLSDAPFALGYPIAGVEPVSGPLSEGLRSACPLTLEAFGDAGLDPAAAFAPVDPSERRPLADRFAAWCAATHGEEVGALARFEAALRHAGVDPLAGALGPGEGEPSLSDRVRVLDEAVDPIALSDGVESGAIGGRLVDERLRLVPVDGSALPTEPTRLAIARSPEGEVAAAELDGAEDAVLADLGMLAWARWSVGTEPPTG